MALTEVTTAVYLFVIMSMASVVAILVHFISTGQDIPFAVFYIWQATLCVLSLFAALLLVLFRKNTTHVVRNDGRHFRRAMQAMRHTVIVICGVGSVVLPLYEAVREFPCTKLENEPTFYMARFISWILISTMIILQLIFVTGFKKYRCVSGYARVLVSFILSFNFCVCINFVLNIMRASNTKTEQQVNSTEETIDFKNVLTFSLCRNKTQYMDNDHNVAERIFKYTNTLTIEFALFSFGILFPMWNIWEQKPDEDRNHGNDTDVDSISETQNVDDNDRSTLTGQSHSPDNKYTGNKIVNVLKRSLIYVSEHSLILSLAFVLPILGLHAYSELDNYAWDRNDVVLEINGKHVNETVTAFEKANYVIQTGYTYVVSIMPAVAYFIGKKFKGDITTQPVNENAVARNDNIAKWRVNVDNVLLVLSGCGHVVLVLFETADSIAGFLSNTAQIHLTEEILYFVKILFHYIGIYFQIMLIMKAQGLATRSKDTDQQGRRLIVKGIIIFLCVCNVERWLADSFLPPTDLRFVIDIQQEDTLGKRNWWFITEFLFPVVTFYRLMSALMLFEVEDRL